MSLKQVQEQVNDWISQYKVGYFPPHRMLGQLTEEVWEVARAVNILHGNKPPKEWEKMDELGEELADVLFSVICMANAHNIDLDLEREKTMQKRYGRDDSRREKKEK